MYRTFIRGIIDYGCVAWYPTNYTMIDPLENVLRVYTKKIPAIRNLHYWDRIKQMDISSVQRRVERFFIITTWKILEDLKPGKERINHVWTRKGREIVPPRSLLNMSSTVVKLRQDSFYHCGALLFNACPREVRDTTGVSLNVFKGKLNKWLRWVPDHPRDLASGYMPDAYDSIKQTPSNSIRWWRVLMEQEYPRYPW